MQNNIAIRKLLEGEEPLWLPMLSGSMAPSLLPGDELYIDPGIKSFKTGDIVVFFSGGLFFCHRVLISIKLNGKKYILEKGDANHHASFLSYDKALGRITKMRREENILSLCSVPAEKLAKKTAFKSLRNLIRVKIINYIKQGLKKCIS